MTKMVDYRVRAITRFIVTRYVTEDDTPTKSGSVQGAGEFENIEVANTVASALADQEKGWGALDRTVTLHPYNGPLPGKVMRAKLNLTSRAPMVSLQWGPEAKGRTEMRQNSQGRDYQWVDPQDPANYQFDGELLTFHAVCPPTCDPNGAEENLIFGQATPNASFSMHVRNPDVLAAIEQGQAYYVDFTPAPGPVAAP